MKGSATAFKTASMTTLAHPTIHFLQSHPMFAPCSARDLARLIPFIEERTYHTDEVIFAKGETADHLYFVRQGQVQLLSGARSVDQVCQGFLGEEAALGVGQYSMSAIAQTSGTLLSIRREALSKITDDYPKLVNEFYQSLIDHYLEQHLRPAELGVHTARQPSPPRVTQQIGWWLALGLPVLMFVITAQPALGIPKDIQLFLTVFSAALVLWTFNLVSEFIPAIIIIFALLVLGIAPTSVVLSGFASSSFFLALSIFALGAVLATSGLTYRCVLMILRVVPQSQFSYSLTLFLIGFCLTPVLPSANGRTQLTTPLLVDMVDALQLRKQGKGASRLAFAAFTGSTFMSFAFLSSKPIQFVLLGLLPGQVRERFSLPYWTLAAAVAAGVAILGFLIISHFLFRNQEKTALSPAQLDAQLAILGPMTPTEWMALGSITIFLVGVLTSSLHGD